MEAIDQQPHLLRGVLQHEFLRLDKLRDSAQPRSTLLPGRTTPTRLGRCSRSRGSRAHNRAHHPLLGRRRGPRKKRSHQKQTQDSRKETTRTHRSLLPAEVALRFWVLTNSTDGSSAAPSRTSNAARLADGPAYQKQPSSLENPTTQSSKRAKQR